MVGIPRKVVVAPGWPPKHAEDYMYVHVYNNRYSASHFTLQMDHHVGSRLVYINTLSPIVDCFLESTVTLDVESINGRFITLASALFTGLILKTTPSLFVYCICNYTRLHNSVIRLQNVA